LKGKAAGCSWLAALLFELYGFRNNSGSLAIFAAIRRASSLVNNLAADRRPGSITGRREMA
jgi:hypothetical protein